MSSSSSGSITSSSKITSATFASSATSTSHKTTYTGNFTIPTALPTQSSYNSGAGSIKSVLGSTAGLFLAAYMLLL
jgi:hypothetical protein